MLGKNNQSKETVGGGASREETAHKVAWAAVKQEYKKEEKSGKWRRNNNILGDKDAGSDRFCHAIFPTSHNCNDGRCTRDVRDINGNIQIVDNCIYSPRSTLCPSEL